MRLALALVLACGACASAEESRIAFMGVWDRAAPLIERASRETGIGTAVLHGDEDLSQYDLLLVLNLDPARNRDLLERLKKALAVNRRFLVVPLDKRDTHAELGRAGLLHADPRVPLYWRANGLTNVKRLLVYLSTTYLGGRAGIEPPAPVPEAGYYRPGCPDAFEDLASYRARAPWRDGAPVAALLMHQSFWITGDTRVIDAEVVALEQEGFNVVPLFAEAGGRLRQMLLEVHPDVIVEDRHGATWEGEATRSPLEELDAPYLRPISMLGYTIEEWQADPRGLSFRDVGMFMTIQESKGTIEPVVVGGLQASIQGFRLHQPIPERVERFAKRAAAWASLRRKPNADKRIAIVYYNKSLGKDDLMRGSPTGGFLDAPESLIRVLPRLRDRGFAVDGAPTSASQLIDWIRERGRNIGPWAQGELEALADRPDAILVPAEQLDAWMATRLTDAHRKALLDHFGPPPGRLMVVTRNGKKFIVIPAIRLGNVLLAPQPERGEKQDEALLHSRDVPPPYHYLAFYWWLQEGFGPDAVIHWGTHGTLELLPGKEAGLSKDDWSDLCVGTMPVINPWIMDNLGEATISRRRSYALLVDHLVPPAVNAGLSDGLRTLHDDIDKWSGLEPGLLKQEFLKRITRATVDARIDETLGIEGLPSRLLAETEVDRVASYLHEVYNATIPATLHVLGTPPDEKRLAPYLVTILRKPFLDRLAQVIPVPTEEDRYSGDRTKWLRARAEALVEGTVLGPGQPPEALRKDIEFARDVLTRLRCADDEIANLLRALEGRFIPPGPGPEPVRNPASVPPGRNLYALNPEEIPTKASWEVAVRLVNEMLKTRHPRKVGMDLNGMETMRDFGVMEAQILYLMGTRPVWDANGLASDVELIPRAELGRQRIDVFVAMGGMYKENFPTRVALIDKAVRLASEAVEEDNLVREGTERLRERLVAKGFAAQRAEALAFARVFGTKPGNLSGTNILYLVPRSGVWETEDEVSSVYIDNMSFAYTGDVWGKRVDGLYEEAIQGTDTLVRVWASNMTSQLSNHHAYEYLGGLSMAVKRLTGKEPEALIADVRDPDGARMREFEEVLATTLRAELLNRKWIEGMKEHDYAGAGHMAEMVKNTFGWDVTRSGSVSDGVWRDIYEVYVRDRYALGMREWFQAVNPHALEEIAATMIEASRKGYWKADAATIAALSRLYADLVGRHGPSAGLVSGGNTKLDAYVQERLTAPGDRAVAERFADAMAKSSGAPAESRVRGPKLESTPREDARGTDRASDSWGALVAAGLLLVFVLGLWKRSGAAR